MLTTYSFKHVFQLQNFSEIKKYSLIDFYKIGLVSFKKSFNKFYEFQRVVGNRLVNCFVFETRQPKIFQELIFFYCLFETINVFQPVWYVYMVALSFQEVICSSFLIRLANLQPKKSSRHCSIILVHCLGYRLWKNITINFFKRCNSPFCAYACFF